MSASAVVAYRWDGKRIDYRDTLVTFDGHPAWPDAGEIWRVIGATRTRHFGCGAALIGGWMKAGVRAQQRMALRECAAYLQKAIALLNTLPGDDPERLRSEMEAQLMRIIFLVFIQRQMLSLQILKKEPDRFHRD